MNPQHSFIHKLVVPFLIGVLLLSARLVYRHNPEIMDTEPFYQMLVKNRETSESRVAPESHVAELLTAKAKVEPGHVSHRYVEAKEENFTPIQWTSNDLDWSATAEQIVAKDKSHVAVYNFKGEMAWSFTPPKGVSLSSGPAAVIGHALFVTSTDGRAYALNLINGQVIWYTANANTSYFHSPIASGKDLVLFIEEKANQLWSVALTNSETGELKNRFGHYELPLAGDPVALDGIIYFATQTGHLMGIQLATGESAWTSVGSSSFRSSPKVTADRIYLTNEDGLALIFDRKNGRKLSEVELDSPLSQAVVPVEGSTMAMTIDSNNNLLAMDLKGTKRLWRYKLNMTGDNNPFRLIRLTQQSFTQLNFASELRGWTAWTPCNSTRICIFDLKNGLLLHRIELKGKPVAQFEWVGENNTLIVPLERDGHVEFVAFDVPVLPSTAGATASATPVPAKPAGP
jgi:hypothetical protein